MLSAQNSCITNEHLIKNIHFVLFNVTLRINWTRFSFKIQIQTQIMTSQYTAQIQVPTEVFGQSKQTMVKKKNKTE